MNKKYLKKKRIDQILLEKNFVNSRNKAQALIMAGQVFCDNQLIKKSSELFNLSDNIYLKKKPHNWVSRGALKLEPVILIEKIKIKNKICLDIGSSTGGFTQVLLQHGAKKVYSVDVGYGQIHEKIKFNPKVVSLEKTNARYLSPKQINDKIDLIVCDASFISLKKIIDQPISLLNQNGYLIALIKPQFEAQRKEINKGVIYDPKIHQRICRDITSWLSIEKKLDVLKIIESPLKGPKGNLEFFVLAIKKF